MNALRPINAFFIVLSLRAAAPAALAVPQRRETGADFRFLNGDVAQSLNQMAKLIYTSERPDAGCIASISSSRRSNQAVPINEHNTHQHVTPSDKLSFIKTIRS